MNEEDAKLGVLSLSREGGEVGGAREAALGAIGAASAAATEGGGGLLQPRARIERRRGASFDDHEHLAGFLVSAAHEGDHVGSAREGRSECAKSGKIVALALDHDAGTGRVDRVCRVKTLREKLHQLPAHHRICIGA